MWKLTNRLVPVGARLIQNARIIRQNVAVVKSFQHRVDARYLSYTSRLYKESKSVSAANVVKGKGKVVNSEKDESVADEDILKAEAELNVDEDIEVSEDLIVEDVEETTEDGKVASKIVDEKEEDVDDSREESSPAVNLAYSPDKYYTESGDILLKTLFEAGVHLGHKASVWNPKMESYLLGKREGIHIFDLEKTVVSLRRVLNVLRHLAYEDGIILFVCTRPQFEGVVRNAAISCKEYYITKKWVGGTLTNRQETLKADILPDVIIFLSMPVNKTAIHEAHMAGVPTIGICDSDCDPDLVTYVVPGNDDSPSAVSLYCKLFAHAIKEGKAMRKTMEESASEGGAEKVKSYTENLEDHLHA
eukprot:Colp12_sorted_trinity150504_noHs@18653